MEEETYVLVKDTASTIWRRRKDDKYYYRHEGYSYLYSDMSIVETVKADGWADLDWSKTSLVVPEEEAEVGWLDRSGKFYGCPKRKHDDYAELILGKSVAELERTGWTRVYGPPGAFPNFVCLYRLGLSAEQRNWLQLRGYNIQQYD